MDNISIQRLILGLSKRDFDGLVDVLLTQVYGLKHIDVDGKGDRGSDRKVLKDAGGTTSAAYQVTIQERNWRAKAVADAHKAVANLGATRYFFLTSLPHEPATMRALENSIESELHIPATCLAGRDLAGMILVNDLLPVVLDALDVPHNLNVANEPDEEEILLNSYIVLGEDALKLREGVYEDAILAILHRQGDPVDRQDLVAQAAMFLGDESRMSPINRRVDSLLARGLLRVTADGPIALSESCATSLSHARRIYELEFRSLANDQSRYLETRHALTWNQQAARRAATLLAKMFIKRQIDQANNAAMDLKQCEFVRALGDPLQDLRDMLHENGLSAANITPAIADLAEMASKSPLIAKLVTSALFVAIEGANPLASVKALGASSWDQVTCIIDASVAIPYLCARLYRPTHTRFSPAYTRTLTRLHELRANLRIPYVYIQEASAHLLRAMAYCNYRGFDDDLSASANGFVSHYYQLKVSGKAPESLLSYLKAFSEQAIIPSTDKHAWARRIMPDIQAKLRRYHVEYQSFAKDIPLAIRKIVEEEYAHVLERDGHPKHPLLVANDVSTLAHIRQMILEKGQHILHLTWDLITLSTAMSIPDCGWTVSPDEATDFVNTVAPRTDVQLTALTHQLASIHVRPEEIGAIILDRIAIIAKDRLEDWEFQDRIRTFKQALLQRIDTSKANYVVWIREQTDTFLAEEGIDVPSQHQASEQQEPMTDT